MCVFCKKGPHYNTLGDLFGPYIISKEESNSSTCDFSGDEKDISDAQKRGGRNKKSLRSNNMVEHFQKMSKKVSEIPQYTREVHLICHCNLRLTACRRQLHILLERLDMTRVVFCCTSS